MLSWSDIDWLKIPKYTKDRTSALQEWEVNQ